jgi:LacI family transcriptional regulator
VANDYCALGVLHGLSEDGFRVPEDVAVVGYDDIALAGLPFIDLTTVSSRIEEMASLGCEAVIDLVQRRETCVDPTILAPELKIRGTCGASRRQLDTPRAPLALSTSETGR